MNGPIEDLTVDLEGCAKLLKVKPRTLSSYMARGKPVPPRCNPPGYGPLWLVSDVIKWLESHREAKPK